MQKTLFKEKFKNNPNSVPVLETKKPIEQAVLFNDFNLEFESEWIKQFSYEEDDIFQFKEKLRALKIPKKNKVVFAVDIEQILKDYPDLSDIFREEFRTREDAKNFFECRKQELEFFHERNQKNEVFDGRRYFFKINKKNKPIRRVL